MVRASEDRRIGSFIEIELDKAHFDTCITLIGPYFSPREFTSTAVLKFICRLGVISLATNWEGNWEKREEFHWLVTGVVTGVVTESLLGNLFDRFTARLQLEDLCKRIPSKDRVTVRYKLNFNIFRFFYWL